VSNLLRFFDGFGMKINAYLVPILKFCEFFFLRALFDKKPKLSETAQNMEKRVA
jgi:hypothetical protein